METENILTVDLEDWFHICGVDDLLPESNWNQMESRIEINTSKILDIFAKNEVKATFFVLGYIAEKHPDLILKIAKAGHEIATHGYAHGRVYTMDPHSFRQDLKKSIKAISHVIDNPVKGFRAPEWSIRDDSLWALDILKQEGFLYDSSMAPLAIIGNPKYSKVPHQRLVKGGKLWEMPPLVAETAMANLPIGGGWGLRVFPYFLIKSTIQKLNSQGHPGVIFLHPREFDTDCPKVPLPLSRKFVLGAKLERTEKRLNRLLRDFQFISIFDFITRNNR